MPQQIRAHYARRVVAAGTAALLSILTFSIPAATRAAELAAGIPVNAEREAYFGELHLHTSYSLDSYFLFGTLLGPDDAYRFARGQPVNYLDADVTRSTRPLDFMAVTDHAELMGIPPALQDPGSELSLSESGRNIRERRPGAARKLSSGWMSGVEPLPDVNTGAIARSAWQRMIEAANRHYRPGEFTTFIAYEWTAQQNGPTLHRNVIFRGDTAPEPFSARDSSRPEDLWNFLERIRAQGHEALAIPHNPNFSNGLAFDWVDSQGRPIDQAYAEMRVANEPLVEISQSKGQSETTPALSPNDEFSTFELSKRPLGGASGPHGSYVREALGRGLEIAQRTGVNPYKYGFAGASDFHNGLSDSAESAYAGTTGAVDLTKRIPNIEEVPELDQWAGVAISAEQRAQWTAYQYQSASGSLTGVWAEQNTREAIYDALRRKETFATSGTRLKFRFFGGWNFQRTLLQRRDWIARAYRTGVPMGSDLPARPDRGAAPSFAIWAMKDPDGANLDRVQVVKVWLEKGKHVEKVYDVALSDGRKVAASTGKAPAVGNTVDLQKATYANTIGSIELAALWRDPDFDPQAPAAYYLRVLEIPTPRWSTIVAARRGLPLPAGLPPTLQERGWSSPIWYTPRDGRQAAADASATIRSNIQ